MCSGKRTLSEASSELSSAQQAATVYPPDRHEATQLVVEASEKVRQAALRIEAEHDKDFTGSRRNLIERETTLEGRLNEKEGQRVFEGDAPSLAAVEDTIMEVRKTIQTLEKVCN